MALKMMDRPGPLPPEYVRDENWLDGQMSAFVNRYPDKWVAVLNESVVAVGDDLGQVIDSVEANHPNTMPVVRLIEGTPGVY